MLFLEVVSIAIAVCSIPAAVLFLLNLIYFRRPGAATKQVGPIAVLIPARNEEQNIRACLDCVLASCEVQLEVMVYDDESSDHTASIVAEVAARDSRVKMLTSKGLPEGWNGKQYACWQLANSAKATELLFLDADVRLAPWAIARCVAERRSSNVALLSGFPRQVTIGFMEAMLLPLINFVLLSFLPMRRMRNTTKPAYAAGCGQFFLVESEPYFSCGGHASIRQTRHDGLMLPRLFREHNFRTDLVDLTELAEVRMYGSSSEVWRGLAKNATEGLAAPKRIIPFTALLFWGHVLPFITVCYWFTANKKMVFQGANFLNLDGMVVIGILLCLAFLFSSGTRLLAAYRFRSSWAAALLHPLGVFLLIVLQWYALTKQALGSPVIWRTRTYSSRPGPKA